MNPLKILIIKFKNEISRGEIPLFRGAIINATEQAGLLFHNHEEDGSLRYAYPLIQYKRINRRAAIVCMGEGTEAIGQFFSSCNFNVVIGERQVKLEVASIKAYQQKVQLCDDEFVYHLRRWLPLNQENYNTYCQEDSLAKRCSMLERLLTANILSFAKGVGVHFEQEVKCAITELSKSKIITYKGVKMMSFDAEFKANVSLPDYIGLGKGVSLGMGTVAKKHKELERPPLSFRSKKVFLLGGHDLEMLTIKDIVESRTDCLVLDKGLRWDNARLSAYQEEIEQNQETEFYAVELMDDRGLPEEYLGHLHIIDHHNDKSGLPSSLEQVAHVLGVDLNRFQKLVAANDSGYIPAMKALQATDEEVQEIRRLDRAAQGVTEEDEKLAEASIASQLQKSDQLWIVKSFSSNFSPICDRLYPYKRLLIFTESEWMFYGEGKSEVEHYFVNEIKNKKVFYGGGENGYIGCVKGAFDEKEIEQYVNQIRERYDA